MHYVLDKEQRKLQNILKYLIIEDQQIMVIDMKVCSVASASLDTITRCLFTGIIYQSTAVALTPTDS